MSHSKVNSSLLLFMILFSSFIAITPYFMDFSPVSHENQSPAENPATLKINYNWTKTWLVSISTTNAAYDSAVAVDGNGNVHIVWEDSSPYYDGNSNYDIVYRIWNATTGNWGGFTNTTDLISKFSSSNAQYPDIAVDGKGNIHIVWQDATAVFGDTGSTNDIFYRYWNVTTKIWGGHNTGYDLITPNSTAACQNAAIAVDIKGNVHVVWADITNTFDSDNYNDICYRYWNATTNVWGTIEHVSKESNQSAWNPTIAVDSSGNIHVAWQDATNLIRVDNQNDIFYKFRNATTGIWRGKMNTTDEVSMESTASATYPSITLDAIGGVNIVWYDASIISGITDTYSDTDIFYKYWDGTRWTGHTKALDVLSDDMSGSGSSYNPKIASDNLGNLYVVWRQSGNYHGDGSDDDIAYRIWNVTTQSWPVVPDVVSTESTSPSNLPDLAVDATGAMHVVWQETPAIPYKIYYKKTMTTPPAPTILAPIFPNPNPNFEVELSWPERISATQYYIYRNTSFISSVMGLTPIAMVSKLNYMDIITQNGTFYYVIVGANLMGNSSISNCQSVTMLLIKGQQRITITSNALFTNYASGGNGTATNPWIIEKNYINGTTRTCISITGTTDYFILRNSTVFNGDRGVLLKNVINGKLINITARLCKVGFQLNGGQKNQLITNKAYNNTGPNKWDGTGFFLNQSTNNWLNGNQAFKNLGNREYSGIGFLLYSSSYNNLTNNIANNNNCYNDSGPNTDGLGFLLYSSNYNNLTQNTAFTNRGGGYWDSCGMFIHQSSYNRVIKNYLYNHLISGERAGLFMRSTSNTEIINNTLSDNGQRGIYLLACNTATVKYNKVFNNPIGMEFWGGTHTIFNNTVFNNDYGIEFTASASNCLISNNTVYSNTNHGFYASGSALKFYNNTVYKNNIGIELSSSSSCMLIDNIIFNNTNRGLSGYGNYTTSFRNRIYQNDIGIYVGRTSGSSTANTNLTQNLITNNREGIHLQKGYNTTIKFNRIYNNTVYCIYLDRTNVSSITWNELLDNAQLITQINSKDNVIQSNIYFRGTTLYNILPNPVIDGWVSLSWQSVPWATYYLAYRKYNAMFTSFIDLIFMTPVLNVTINQGTDYAISPLGIYYYVIIAANATCWTSISNNQWVNVIGYPHPATPVLNGILPNVSYNGLISLDWNDAQNATRYYVYKHTATITAGNVGTLSPISKVTQTSYTDTSFINGTFYYAIIAGNDGYNSSVSNCRSVLVQRQPVPPPPSLNLIVPSPDYDGVIKLDWTDTTSTTKYYVYRDMTLISGLAGRIPRAIITQSNYTDIISINNTYFYVVVAGNLGFNGSMSVCRNVTVTFYPLPSKPILNQIIPGIDYYGIIQLEWTDTVNTAKYYVYRSISIISTVNGLTPIDISFQSAYTDVITENNTYYYVIVASNPTQNSSSSNCRGVTVILYSVPGIPILNPIQPFVDYDGIIQLNWTSTAATNRYYVYRERVEIYDITGLKPIAMVTTGITYIDVISANGTYYYAILAGNPGYNGSACSNYWSVTVVVYTHPGSPLDYTWLIIVIVISACAIGAMLVVFKVRSKPQRTRAASLQLPLIKDKLKGIKSEWKENFSIEDKIKALKRNVIPIEELIDFSDAELSSYFNQAFIPIPIKLIEFLQRLDAPSEDKVEILAEFNNLSEEQKQEYLKELNEL